MEGRGLRRHPTGKPGARSALFLASLMTFVVLFGPAVSTSHEEHEWARDLQDLETPYNMATGVTTMVLAEDGHTLVVGSDTGGVVFVNATTGEVEDAAETGAHGAVRDIRLDASGRLAAIVYSDGYVAVVSTTSSDPLLTLHTEGGVPEAVRPFVAAVPSPDGRYVLVTGQEARLFHRGPEAGATFKEIGLDPDGEGPFVWFHRVLKVFGVLSPDGEVTLYTYSSDSMRAQGKRDLTSSSAKVTAFAVSGDGNRFAVALDSGTVTRYTPSLNPSAPQLIPDYEGDVGGPPLGLALDEDGQRLTAWSGRELLWIDGCNRNLELCDGKSTEKDTVRLRPPGFGTRIGTAAVTPDLTRAVLQIEGETRERRLYNLPGLDHFVLQSETSDAGHSALSPQGTTLFLADGTTVRARMVTPAELPPPQVTVTWRGGSDGGADDGGFDLLGVSTEVLLFGGIGILALLLLVVLASVIIAARSGGRSAPRPLPSLAPAPDEALSTLPSSPSGGAGIPGTIRHVAPSAAPASPPPEGLLVLEGCATPTGPVALTGLDLVVRRSEVLRVAGPPPALQAFAALLGGHVPFQGSLSVGGASARETPVLFRRRVRVGLGDEPAGDVDAATLFRDSAVATGLPVGLVERRMQKDLGWMGDRLHRPTRTLRPLDRWKVRLALVLVDRPHLVVLAARDLPWEDQTPERVETLRRVLSGVARHYECLVLLLDDGSVDAQAARRLADEELTLTQNGFTGRTLLDAGHPVARAPEGNRRPAGRRRRTS